MAEPSGAPPAQISVAVNSPVEPGCWVQFPDGYAPEPLRMTGLELSGTYVFKHARVSIVQYNDDCMCGCCYAPIPCCFCPMYRPPDQCTSWASKNNFYGCPNLNSLFSFTKNDNSHVMLWWPPCCCCIRCKADSPYVCHRE
jgi:hypothetical protein